MTDIHGTLLGPLPRTVNDSLPRLVRSNQALPMTRESCVLQDSGWPSEVDAVLCACTYRTHPKRELVVVVVWTMYDMTMCCVIKQWKKAPELERPEPEKRLQSADS